MGFKDNEFHKDGMQSRGRNDKAPRGDDVLTELAALARAQEDANQERFDERWDKLSAGLLDEDGQARLEQEARFNAESRLAYEAFRPIDPQFKAQIVAKLRHQLQTSATEENPPPSAQPAIKRQRTAAVWRPWAAAASLLLALGLGLLIGPSVRQDTPALPEYLLVVEGATQNERSLDAFGTESSGIEPSGTETSDRLIFDAGNRLSLTFRPASGVDQPIEAQFFVLQGQALVPWTPPTVNIATSGAVRVEGQVGQNLGLPTGHVELIAVLGYASDIPEPDAILARLQDASTNFGPTGFTESAPWILLRKPLILRGE